MKKSNAASGKKPLLNFQLNFGVNLVTSFFQEYVAKSEKLERYDL